MEQINSLLDLTGKVAVVTGGGDGIGRGCALVLAAAGATVVVSNRTESKAATVAREITDSGGKALAAECDVTVETFGTVNILVNNAGHGGGGRENPFNIDLAYVERIYAVNVFAPWMLCKLAAPYMKQSNYGSIINITSMSSVNNDPGMAIYGSSKAALNHLTSNLAYDYGPTRTRALSTVLTPEIEQAMLRHTPLQRLGEVADIAQAVLYFAAPISSWVSGQTLMVNGGGVQTL